MSTVPPADFGLDFQVRKSVHAVQRGPLVPLAVSSRIVSALLDGTAPAVLTVDLAPNRFSIVLVPLSNERFVGNVFGDKRSHGGLPLHVTTAACFSRVLL